MSIKETSIYQAMRRAKWTVIGWGKSRPWKSIQVSETSKCRESLAPFCTGDGIDVGFGGDPIVPHAICLDLPTPYARYKSHPQHLHGSAADLSWFRDGSLDWLYSSHVLEDFTDPLEVLDEWLRVVKPGGVVVLYLPDEKAYRQHCLENGRQPNAHHIHENFGLAFIKSQLGRKSVRVVHERFPVGIYSFELVLKKTI